MTSCLTHFVTGLLAAGCSEDLADSSQESAGDRRFGRMGIRGAGF